MAYANYHKIAAFLMEHTLWTSESAGDLQLPQRPPKAADEFYEVEVFSFYF